MTTPVLVSGRYEVIRPLGRGSFAHTLLARDVRLGRQVTLKVLHPRSGQDLKAYELFEREAAVLRDLRHPGVPAIHSTFRAEKIGFEEKLTRVRYEFEARGRRRRGSEQVLPASAEHWERGDAIQILYLPDRDFDSVIISTS